MAGVVRFGISMDQELLERFDRRIARKGYENRSEAIRDLVRADLVAEEWERAEGEVVGTISLVYDHHLRQLAKRLTGFQHEHYHTILSSLHVHLDEDNCLEVLVVRGSEPDIRALAERLIATKGVKHGRLTLTTTGRRLP
ncbi:MAG: nickel-responsive transcriptional regulator NikR [Thermodesulfobacteriota bacterium]|jgi:CopG family nickel-responsive transcriptional regulator